MKNTIKIAALLAGIIPAGIAFAGNEDRVGSAGASELLINPWARSAAMGSAGVSSTSGLEATFMNVAGLAMMKDKTQISFVRTAWLVPSSIAINQGGLAQKVGESGFLGLTFNTINFGDLDVTTENSPEGGLGTFTPRYFNIGISYAKAFSKSIYGGITMKSLTEGIANLKATGMCFDAGINYVTGERDELKFGITLKNVGPPMKFSGDGFSTFSTLSSGFQINTEQRSAKFELPSQVNIGASYDFIFKEDGSQMLTLAGTFTSNSFSKDNWRIGADYSMVTKKASFNLRAGYVYEKGIFSKELGDATTAFSGPSAGISVDWITGQTGNRIAIDYTYRASNTFNGSHSIGIRINIAGAAAE